jgi:hypothetical protein
MGPTELWSFRCAERKLAPIVLWALDRTKLLIERKLYTEEKSILILASSDMWLLVERILCASRP